jgi:hypothetical protein
MEIPKNLRFTWHRGSKSFVEINQFKNGKIPLIEYHEANEGEQLPEEIFATVFQTALGLAKMKPKERYQYVRYDNENIVPENDNNAPFRDENGMVKVIEYLGYVIKSKI